MVRSRLLRRPVPNSLLANDNVLGSQHVNLLTRQQANMLTFRSALTEGVLAMLAQHIIQRFSEKRLDADALLRCQDGYGTA